MTTLWFDCETFSEADLFSVGTHAYAEHPSTEITVVQWAIDDGEPVVVDCTLGTDHRIYGLMSLLEDSSVTVVAHNSAFDRTLLRHCWGIDVPVERWRDTMVKALLHGLPGALGKVAQALKLPADELKDARGKELIQLFCKPRPKNHKLRRATRETHPAEWAEFLAYSRQDIVSMRAVDRALPSWNYREGHPELALWHLDQRINDRGFAVDVGLADAALSAVAGEQSRLKQETAAATDGLVTSPSRRDQLLVYILAEYGVALPDMKADTLRRRIEDPDLPDGVKLLLSLRLEATKTSTAKYKVLKRSASHDHRLRNTMQFAGAPRTSRWSHKLFQPGNMPRPTYEVFEDEIEALKGGYLHVVRDDVMQFTSNVIRGCIIAPPGRKLCVADLSNIEGRGLVQLAGELWKLKAFREFDQGIGHDLYKLSYARSFGADPDDVDKGQRQIGKVQELGLGYEGGVAAFLTFAAVYGMDLDALADAVWAAADHEMIERAQAMLAWFKKKRRSTHGLSERVWVACEILVLGWRDAHPNVVALWKAAADGVRGAIANPGQVFKIGKHLAARRDGSWLRVRLPSGRYLCYLHPEVADDGQISYVGVDQYTRQWKRIKTYGGKLVENCTQAFARDVLASSMPAIEAEGYGIVLSVHDELLAETPDTDDFSHERLAELMSVVPPWAAGMPLAAAGFETYRYRKG